MGLRSLGPVWSRPTVFGHGVPFRFPGDPDTGPGLTEAGKNLVRVCNELGILIDLSHMNEAGFNDVAALSDTPLVATHSNAHALCASARNLTDRQLAQVRETGGMVGLNFATFFLREDGRASPAIAWDVLLRQMDYLIEHLGEDHVGLGSDFDGCVVPDRFFEVAPQSEVSRGRTVLDRPCTRCFDHLVGFHHKSAFVTVGNPVADSGAVGHSLVRELLDLGQSHPHALGQLV